ncbi:MAG: hypothetical protein QM679_12620, partial [Patulibacter sp.]
RRRYDRRVADRRRGTDRRRAARRAPVELDPRGGVLRAAWWTNPQHALTPRAAQRTPYAATAGSSTRWLTPVPERRALTPRILRALVLVTVAIGCLLAATLQDASGATLLGL